MSVIYNGNNEIYDETFLKDMKDNIIEKDRIVYFNGDLFNGATKRVLESYVFELSRQSELDMETKINRVEGLVQGICMLYMYTPFDCTVNYEDTFNRTIKKLLIFEREYKQEKIKSTEKMLIRLNRIQTLLMEAKSQTEFDENIKKYRDIIDIVDKMEERPEKRKKWLNAFVPKDTYTSDFVELTPTEKDEIEADKNKIEEDLKMKMNETIETKKQKDGSVNMSDLTDEEINQIVNTINCEKLD